MNRSTFIKTGILGSGALLSVPTIIIAQNRDTFEPEEIEQFVRDGHNNLSGVQATLEKTPLIINCANQWVRGDFETAIGGACHVGNKDVADYLVSKGARLDLFNYAYFGYADFVKKQVNDYPGLLNSPGPHGFTLLHHAKVGGHQGLMDWLQEKGLTETHFKGIFG